ncbi:MAG TPA: hypothetical protein VG452_11300 [Egibacteraceae bacterium]|nr:hypothetical protein [Egibacteraceae bacterium]
MRRSARALAEVGPEERLARAIAALPAVARRALAEVADREDLPLVAETWHQGSGGCLVANVVRARGGQCAAGSPGRTFDVRFLELMPELSSRDLNRLIVAWDEAAARERRPTDVGLRRLLRGALAWATGIVGAGEDVVAPDDPGARCVSALS